MCCISIQLFSCEVLMQLCISVLLKLWKVLGRCMLVCCDWCWVVCFGELVWIEVLINVSCSICFGVVCRICWVMKLFSENLVRVKWFGVCVRMLFMIVCIVLLWVWLFIVQLVMLDSVVICLCQSLVLLSRFGSSSRGMWFVIWILLLLFVGRLRVVWQ